MIIPYGKLKFNEKEITLLSEAPLNTLPFATVHATGFAEENSDKVTELGTLQDISGLENFIKTNGITVEEDEFGSEDGALIDAYACLIDEAVKVKANAAKITFIQRTLLTGDDYDETVLTADLYKLPNRVEKK